MYDGLGRGGPALLLANRGGAELNSIHRMFTRLTKS